MSECNQLCWSTCLSKNISEASRSTLEMRLTCKFIFNGKLHQPMLGVVTSHTEQAVSCCNWKRLNCAVGKFSVASHQMFCLSLCSCSVPSKARHMSTVRIAVNMCTVRYCPRTPSCRLQRMSPPRSTVTSGRLNADSQAGTCGPDLTSFWNDPQWPTVGESNLQ